MNTIAVVESDSTHKTSLLSFLSKEFPLASVVCCDDVAAVLGGKDQFSSLVIGESEFKSALRDPALAEKLSKARVVAVTDNGSSTLYYEITIAPRSDAGSRLRIAADLYLGDLMASIGFKRGCFGFTYLKDAVCHCYFDTNRFHNKITKNIYPAVAALRKVPVANVERSIRNAIRNVDSDPRTHELFRALIGPSANPSNSEVIAALLEKLTAYIFHNNLDI